jgi:hypothetical protein
VHVLWEFKIDMSVPRRIVEQVLVMRSLLDSGRPEGVASRPLLGEVGVFGDHLRNKAVLAVFAVRDGVDEVGYWDRAKGEVEGGLSNTISQ